MVILAQVEERRQAVKAWTDCDSGRLSVDGGVWSVDRGVWVVDSGVWSTVECVGGSWSA